MKPSFSIKYLTDDATGIELIVCRNSPLSYPLHNHISVSVFGLVLDGAISLAVGGKRRECGRGESFFIPPYAPHTIAAKDRYSLATLCVPSKAITKNKADAVNGIRKLLAATDGAADLSPLLDYFANWLAAGENPPPDFSPPLAAAKSLIEHCTAENHSLDALARLAFCSKYHFLRQFKRLIGLTPHRFLLQNRVRRAQRLLKSSGNLCETALAAGFCDQSHFCREFKKCVGLTPTAYRAACESV